MAQRHDTTYSIILVGAFTGQQELYTHALQGSGYQTVHVTHVAVGKALERNADYFGVAIVEVQADLAESVGSVETIRKFSPLTQIIIINSGDSVLNSLEAQQTGAFWILQSYLPIDELLYLIAKGCIVFELTRDVSDLRSAVRSLISATDVSLDTPAMRKLLARAERIASLDATVLVVGESGTGKTTLASYLHQASARRNGPFISISCAAIPRDLMEAELFGHERGAYTGAVSARPGSLELADGGTIFLDEIGELPLDLQPKLLTFLQDRIVKRVGSTKTRKVDVRIICATNRDLAEMVRRREFREDLYYRINVLNLEIPPLRERSQDILPLAESILSSISDKRGTPRCTLAKEAAQSLKEYRWPGNIRELENILERATAFCEGTTINQLDIDLSPSSRTSATPSEAIGSIPLVGMTLQEMERRLISETLTACNGDKAATAKMLGVSLKTIYNKLSS